ncbi:hypothetical protein GPECTOR_110g218 [Gonium pectorale]|uniref:Uncharacterized protein n=1 Tax=Gonium pectorale TaxID=33097 RepID=A0A150FZ80_GONPE|nr:hypothetical protein GPECTOR_110g218 [Gonium pectorale]|eukprot:KXZ42926.1 hypothetical protein GPECTOR_110g218 [Gonium pectorale]
MPHQRYKMDGPNRPSDPNGQRPGGAKAPAQAPVPVLNLGDAQIAGVIMVLLLLGLMRAAMTPCVCL